MWSTTPIMPASWTTSEALITHGDIYGEGEIFCYFDGSVITTYMPKKQLDKFKEIGEKYLDEKYFNKYKSKYRVAAKKWWNWVRKIESVDFSRYTNGQIIKDYNSFIDHAKDSIAYFGSTRTEFTYKAEQRLEEIIRKYFNNDWPRVFGILSTPLSLDDIQREYLDWLSILSKKHDDSILLKHLSKYPWLVFGQYDDKRTLKFLENRKKSEKNTYRLEYSKLKEDKEKLRRGQENIYRKIGSESDEVKYLSDFLQYQSIERMNIKSYWAGSYYLSRHLLNEVSKRINISLSDMLDFVTPPETIELLNGTHRGNIKSIIVDRKESYAIIISDNKLRVVGADEANNLFKEKIKKIINIDNTIKGQIAMLGKATGKVRKVIAGDLDMLQKSIKDFKEGEILVTSMTQPNMMAIARKAAAIIADEGGITSHAAIISRELKIPCIVGCLHSMQVLKDGDLVEVDADKGVVRLLNKKK
ncbi:MAG: PEP-utilizing enzyme [Candidatus Paceibacterota bacterium]